MKTVYVGMSGGVDSSVAALLLKQQGYNVVGVYMKNWTKDLPGMPCPWKDDFTDAKRVAVQLGIEFKTYDFEKQYFEKVVKYMLDGFRAGYTPNPDVVCNQEIKFKLLLDTALEDGADLIATGHYVNTKNGHLLVAKDSNKDQTYFLYRVEKKALEKSLFPLGNLNKTEVRQIAKKAGLVTAEKKESMGICFVGKVGIKDFLKQYIKEKPGDIVDQNSKKIGVHDGAVFYTIGQRHGLEVGGGLPYYVVGKDMRKNQVFVSTDLQDERLWSREIRFSSAHWINGAPKKNHKPMVRTRHRAQLIPVIKLSKLVQHQNLSEAASYQVAEHQVFGAESSNYWTAQLSEEVRALTPGQSAVFYSNDECIGGGIVI